MSNVSFHEGEVVLLSVSTSSYIQRIKKRLAEPLAESRLYAALELRCAVEGRMKQYLEPLEHIPKAHKADWAIPKLGKSIDKAFQMPDHIATFIVVFEDPIDEISLRYIPVSPALQEIASRLGDYLHFPGEAKAERESWIQTLDSLLEEGLAWLEFCASGELLGLPLENKKTKETKLQLAFERDDPRVAKLSRIQTGGTHLIKVSYSPLPATPPRST